MDSTERRPEGARQQSLIAAFPVDPALGEYARWSAIDVDYTIALKSLAQAIEKSRHILRNAGQSVAESSGTPPGSHTAAIAALDSTCAAFQQALQSRSEAQAALSAAQAKHAAAQERAAEVLTARRALVVFAMVLIAGLCLIVFKT